MSHNIKIIEENHIVNITEVKHETVVHTMDDGSVSVVTVGIQGPQGPAMNISDFGVIQVRPAFDIPTLGCLTAAFQLCTSNTADAFFGVAVNGIVANITGTINTIGQVDTPGTEWLIGEALYVGTDGILTQERPAGYLHKVGFAISETRINLSPSTMIIRQSQ